jgi:exopolysaccharide biosynthesis polyprenyl glycosylphosphotransferase
MVISRSWRLPRIKKLLAAADLVCVAGALALAIFLRRGWSGGLTLIESQSLVLLALWSVFPVIFYICGLYENDRLNSRAMSLVSAAVGVTGATICVAAASYLLLHFGIGRGILLGFATFAFGATVLVRLLYVQAAHHGVLAHRCLVVGTGAEVRCVIDLVEEHPSAGLEIVGIVHSASNDSWPCSREGRYQVLGSFDELESVVAAQRVDRIILAGTLTSEPMLLRRLRKVRYRGVGVVDIVALHEELVREIPLELISEKWLFLAATNCSNFHKSRVKRLLDLGLAALILVPVGLLVLPIAALLIKLTSKGPVLFRQERLGLESRPFMLLKLRTMRVDAEKLTGPVWSTEKDPRITSIGRFLRKFRIDELPQLVNVLRGEMSLIGPRPERPVFVDKLQVTVPFYGERLLVRPGITGWAQVMAPYAASIEDSRRKLQFDLYYVKHLSFTLDLLVLVKTVKTIIFGRERAQGGLATSAGETVGEHSPELAERPRRRAASG